MTTNNEPKLRCTKDYSLFTMHEFNRPLNPANLEYLKQSMLKYGFMPSKPLRCRRENGRRYIYEGHHRFVAAKSLGIAVYFVDDDTDISAGEAEGQYSVWRITDFVYACAKKGLPDYVKLLTYQRKTGLPMKCCISLCGGQTPGGHGKSRSIRSETYRIGDMTHAHLVGEIVGLAKEMRLEFATHGSFAAAISAILRIPEIDEKRLRYAIKHYPTQIRPCSTRDQFIKEIEEVYNFHCPHASRLSLVALAARTMLKRQLSYGKENA
jgi:hypothetical protein